MRITRPMTPRALLQLALLAAAVLHSHGETAMPGGTNPTNIGDLVPGFGDASRVSTTDSLHETVDALVRGQTILIAPGVYELKKKLVFNKNAVTIRGSGRDETIIRCPENDMAMDITATDVRLENLAVSGCRQDSTIVVTGVSTNSESVTEGESDRVLSTTNVDSNDPNAPTIVFIKSCRFEDNRPGQLSGPRFHGGAVWSLTASITIRNSEFVDNTAKNYGGAIYNEGGSLTIYGSTFEANTGMYRGGAIYSGGGSLTIYGSTFEANTGMYSGGAIYSGGSNLTIYGSTFEANTGMYRGAIYSSRGSLTIYGSTFEANTGMYGGAICSSRGSLTIYGSTFEANTGTYSGAIWADAKDAVLDVRASTFTDNSAKAEAGALYIGSWGQAFVSASKFLRNRSGGSGGSIFMYNSSLRITDCIISDNDCAVHGGAVYVESNSLFIFASEVSNNYAGQECGGIYVYSGASVKHSDCTFTRNYAVSSYTNYCVP